jgi:uncharacterized damage-inducible protein DinB
MSEVNVSDGAVFPKAQLLDLFDHMEWADAAIWEAVTQCAAAANDEQLRAYLAHVHIVQRAFLDAWLGEPPTFRDASHFQDLASVRALASPYYSAARPFLAYITQARLDSPIVLPWADHIARELGRSIQHPTLGETVMQVVSHSSYHRGQVNARLRAIDGKPALVDYIAWIWFARPKPIWAENP